MIRDKQVKEIADRWESRKWPNIGYFVHGQAYSDIKDLLNVIAEKNQAMQEAIDCIDNGDAQSALKILNKA